MADTIAKTFIAEKKLTNAQIKTLFSAPFELVAAPGVDKLLMLESYYSIIDTRSGAYVAIEGLDIRPKGTASPYANEVISRSSLQAVDKRTSARQTFAIPSDIIVDKNLPMVLIQPDGDLTGGHDDNYLIIRVYYRILPIGPVITDIPVQD